MMFFCPSFLSHGDKITLHFLAEEIKNRVRYAIMSVPSFYLCRHARYSNVPNMPRVRSSPGSLYTHLHNVLKRLVMQTCKNKGFLKELIHD